MKSVKLFYGEKTDCDKIHNERMYVSKFGKWEVW